MDAATKQKLGTQARVAAVQRLFDAHRAELEGYIVEERPKLGLTPYADRESTEALRAKLRKAEERAEAYRKRLEAAEEEQKLVLAR